MRWCKGALILRGTAVFIGSLSMLRLTVVTGHTRQHAPVTCFAIRGAERYDVVNITQVENNMISKQIYTVQFHP